MLKKKPAGCVSSLHKSGGGGVGKRGLDPATLVLANFAKNIHLAHICPDVLQSWLWSFLHHLYMELS